MKVGVTINIETESLLSPYVRESGFRNQGNVWTRNLEYGIFFIVESGIQDFGIRNRPQGIRNPNNHTAKIIAELRARSAPAEHHG